MKRNAWTKLALAIFGCTGIALGCNAVLGVTDLPAKKTEADANAETSVPTDAATVDAADGNSIDSGCSSELADASSTGINSEMVQFAIPSPDKFPAQGPQRYDIGDGGALTVLDKVTLLTWQRFAGDGDGLPTYNWDEARAFCTALRLDGKSDWRLPSLAEWISIVNPDLVPTTNTVLDKVTFPLSKDDAGMPVVNAGLGGFWTSSPVPEIIGKRWIVQMSALYYSPDAIGTKNFVRCVR